MLAVISTASAQAIHYGWRWIPDRGAVAPNDHDWTPFRDKILIGGYSGRALVCARYDTSFEVRNVVMTDPTGRKYIGQVEQLITNWFEMFVLTNYPNARYFTVGQGLNPGFEAMRMWDTEVNLPITSPILDWSRLPPPQTNAAGVPVGYISQVCALYDYGVPCLPPGTGTATGDKGTNPLPPSRPVDRGNGEYGKGMDYLAEGDFVEALKWFLKADKKGHAGAREQLRTNTHPVFVEWRVTNNTEKPPLAPPNTNAVSSNTNKNEPAQQNLPDETSQATNAMPAAPAVAKSDESAAVAQLKAANAALEERLSKSEEQLRKLQATAAQSKPSSGSWRWYLVLGVLLVIAALWFFSVVRREPG
jgi:hypothetical protein